MIANVGHAEAALDVAGRAVADREPEGGEQQRHDDDEEQRVAAVGRLLCVEGLAVLHRCASVHGAVPAGPMGDGRASGRRFAVGLSSG